MSVWVGISRKSAVTPLIDGLLIVEFWFIKSIVLTVLLPAETGLDTTSLCCSLSLTFPAGNPIWWWWVMSFRPIQRGISSVHIPTIHIHIHTLCVWERAQEGCNKTFYVKRKQSGSVLCAVHAIREKQMGEGLREMVKAKENNGLCRSRLCD